MNTDTRTLEQLKADYEMYCEAKVDIKEQPLDFDQWLELEKDAYMEHNHPVS